MSDLLKENIDEDQWKAMAAASSQGGASTVYDKEPGESKVLRFGRDALRKHIRKWMEGPEDKNSFNGVAQLEQAVKDGLLRPGQIIWGTVSLKHHQDEEDTFLGSIYDAFTPIITFLMMLQMRTFAYLHAAIYVGKYNGVEYVIENGGNDEDTPGKGRIDLLPVADAFESGAHFVVASPPKDKNGRSTRYILIQRALACIGVDFSYNMRSVSCETFILAILFPTSDSFDPIQSGLVRSHKRNLPSNEAKIQWEKDQRNYQIFHKNIVKRLETVKGCWLTLQFYKKEEEKAKMNSTLHRPDSLRRGRPVFLVHMLESYKKFWDCCKRYCFE